MAQYKVLSDRCGLGKKGSTVSVAEDSGINVEALIEGGHIAPVTAKPVIDKDESKEN